MRVNVRVRAIDETGAPVPGALLRIDDETVATTDTDGVATVGIKTGWACVTVSHSMPAEVQLAFTLGEGSSGTFERTVTLRRGAPLTGTVTDPRGAPVPDAVVEVWTAGGTTYVETDADGIWCVPAMQAGEFEVRAGAEGYARGPAISGTHDGRTEQHGVALRVATGARLRGRVRNAQGPVGGLRVYTEMQPGDDRSAVTDDHGRFEIVGLGPGRHHVSAGGWTSSLVMPGDGGEHELEIELPPPEPTPDSAAEPNTQRVASPAPPTATVEGRVIRDGAPVTQFTIVRKGHDRYDWISRPALIQSPDGRFALTELREPSCSVHVLAPGSAWASTEMMSLPPGGVLDLGDIEPPPGFRIAGIVCNVAGDPVEGAHVAIGSPSHEDDPFSDAIEGNFAAVTGHDGTFLFDGVHLNDSHVRISASHPIHGASLEQPLHGSDDEVRLVLVPTGSIDGEVHPHAVMHTGVIVRGDLPEQGSRVAHVRPSGAFTVENLVPGQYSIELVERPRWPRREVRVTVVAGERTRVRLPPP